TMSAELMRPGQSRSAPPLRMKCSPIHGWMDAMSYGPFGHVRSVALGFVLGSLAFIIGDAALSPHPGLNELPFYIACAVGGAALTLCFAMLGNCLIGSRVRDEVELQRVIIAGGKLPSPQCEA